MHTKYVSWIFITTVACGGGGQPSTTTQSGPRETGCKKPVPVVTLPCTRDTGAALSSTGADRLTLSQASYDDLPGWNRDDQAAAVTSLLASCEKLEHLTDDEAIGSGPYGGTAGDWRKACTAAKRVPSGDRKAARTFFETEFIPYAASGVAGRDGKITGYYVQDIRASRTRDGKYQFPILARPADLLSIQLSQFISDGRSRRVWGRVEAGKVVPYWTRSELRAKGAYDNQALLWLDDPVDAMAIQIEGSGKATLPDGSQLWVGFAGKNGRPGGRTRAVMRAMRALRKSQQDRRGRNPKRWRKQVVDRFHEIADSKVSVVFFEVQGSVGAIGTQQVVLTAERSIAVDRAVIPLSTPVFIDTRIAKAPWRKLTIAQDTGGAILGSIRADIYFGDGPRAKAIGSRVHTKGRMWLLLPKQLDITPRPPQ